MMSQVFLFTFIVNILSVSPILQHLDLQKSRIKNYTTKTFRETKTPNGNSDCGKGLYEKTESYFHLFFCEC